MFPGLVHLRKYRKVYVIHKEKQEVSSTNENNGLYRP